MTTSFSDALTTIDPNNTTGLGANWMQGSKLDSVETGNVNGTTARIKVATKDAINALCWEAFPASSPLTLSLFRAYAFPIPLYVDVRGQTQFAQCTNVKMSLGADTSNLTSGPMVQFVASARKFNAYVLLTQFSRNWFLIRYNDSAVTLLASATAGADGDIWKINADVSNPAQVVVKAFRNGSQIASITDSTGSRLSRGIPGMYGEFDTAISPTATAEWRTFSAGTGL